MASMHASLVCDCTLVAGHRLAARPSHPPSLFDCRLTSADFSTRRSTRRCDMSRDRTPRGPFTVTLRFLMTTVTATNQHPAAAAAAAQGGRGEEASGTDARRGDGGGGAAGAGDRCRHCRCALPIAAAASRRTAPHIAACLHRMTVGREWEFAPQPLPPARRCSQPAGAMAATRPARRECSDQWRHRSATSAVACGAAAGGSGSSGVQCSACMASRPCGTATAREANRSSQPASRRPLSRSPAALPVLLSTHLPPGSGST